MAVSGLIDFHTHILPEMDDGSRSVEESLKMLSLSAQQGVAKVALTPHFYADRDNPEHFLKKRQSCYEKLCASMGEGLPQIFPGAEIAYFEGLSQMKELEAFRIQGTKALLIEMPFRPWTERLVADISDLARHSGFTVVLAHVERYDNCTSERVLKSLVYEGVLMQSNANSFLRFMSKSKAFRRLDEGMVHLLGSDCHNTGSRPPNLAEAFTAIQNKQGLQAVSSLVSRGEKLFSL